MKPFQYMFYQLYRFYRKWEDFSAEIPAIAIVSGCMALNLLSVIPLCVNIHFNNWLVTILIISLNIINTKWIMTQEIIIKYDKLWEQQEKHIKRIKGIAIAIYIILSLAVYIYTLRYYQPSTHWEFVL